MKFASVRVVTSDLERLLAFYSLLTGAPIARLTPEFAEVRLEGAVLAICTEGTIQRFNVGAATAAANRSAILEFEVPDVDAVLLRLNDARDVAMDHVMPPTDQPWGNRSMLLRDPDGNLVNVFTRAKQA